MNPQLGVHKRGVLCVDNMAAIILYDDWRCSDSINRVGGSSLCVSMIYFVASC